MREIYMNRKSFLVDNQHNSVLNKLGRFIVILFIGIIGGYFYSQQNSVLKETLPDIPPSVEDTTNLTYPENVPPFIQSLHHTEEKEVSYKTKVLNFTDSTKTFMHSFLHCLKYEEDFHLLRFSAQLRRNIFIQCQSDELIPFSLSKDIELYYNFGLYEKRKEFTINSEYSDDMSYLKNNICLSSGKAHVAISTKGFPVCIEFTNLHIDNFLFSTRDDPTIQIKFHIFNVKNNKIHIYPVSNYSITKRIIDHFFKQPWRDYEDERYNLLLYLDIKSDTHLRLCNFLENSRIDLKGKSIKELYDNQFWLEVSWNPDIQNMICYERFMYTT